MSKFKTFGCGAAVATSSPWRQSWSKGKTIQEALEVTNKAVMEALGWSASRQGTLFSVWQRRQCMRAALWDYAQKNNIVIDGLEPPVNDIDERHHQAE